MIAKLSLIGAIIFIALANCRVLPAADSNIVIQSQIGTSTFYDEVKRTIEAKECRVLVYFDSKTKAIAHQLSEGSHEQAPKGYLDYIYSHSFSMNDIPVVEKDEILESPTVVVRHKGVAGKEGWECSVEITHNFINHEDKILFVVPLGRLGFIRLNAGNYIAEIQVSRKEKSETHVVKSSFGVNEKGESINSFTMISKEMDDSSKTLRKWEYSIVDSFPRVLRIEVEGIGRIGPKFVHEFPQGK